MVWQDIYACVSDDILNSNKCSSSRRGKVRWVNFWINTDVAGEGTCNAFFDKDNKNVKLSCNIPDKWEFSISRK